MKRLKFGRMAAHGALATCLMLSAAHAQVSREVLPGPDPAFTGKMGRTVADSVPAFPPQVRAPAGAPNILLIMTDDVGFGASSTFGGPVPTPVFQALADAGLKYNRFHTTGICSPSRAALLTGRNHHAVGFGLFPEITTGFPGYTGRFPHSAAPIAEVLKLDGYSTAMFGKNHNTPSDELSPTGPFDEWPQGMGFEYFYGFNGYDSNQYAPQLYENTTEVPSPTDPGYHLDTDLANHAIHWIDVQKTLNPDKPFFAYYAPGTAHAPHSAPPEWIARFKGQFDQGWDAMREESFARQKKLGIIPADAALTPRPKEIPAWDSLTADQKRVYAHMMEVYAAALAFADHEIGRVLEAIDRTGQRDNTLVVFVQGDNGASAEGTLQGSVNEGAVTAGVVESPAYIQSMMDKLGGPMAYNHYPVGWAWAMDTPFQWTKQFASHLGGMRNGMVVSWPKRITDRGAVRSQFSHLTDIYPTLLEAAGLPVPTSVDGVKQDPLGGSSLVYSFSAPAAAERHRVQYFELMGNRGIYADGWFAGTTPRRLPWKLGDRPSGNAADDYQWELYDLRSDYSQAHDLAAKDPAKLAAMKALWWKEAEKNKVLPIDDSFADRGRRGPPPFNGNRTVFSYPQDMPRIPYAVAPRLGMGSFSVSTTILSGGGKTANGVIAATGGRFGGWSFYVRDGRPAVAQGLSEQPGDRAALKPDIVLPEGRAALRFDVDYDKGMAGGGARVTISIDGRAVASGHFERTSFNTAGTGMETVDIGRDTGTPVTDDYASPFPFTGVLDRVVIQMK